MTAPLLVQYRAPASDAVRPGLRIGGVVHALPADWPDVLGLLDGWDRFEPLLAAQVDAPGPAVADAVLVAPITFPRKVLCAGANYRSHMQEMGVAPPPAGLAPFFFFKPPTTTVVGPDADVPLPPGPDPRYDWEAELAVVIGHRARDLDEADARGAIAGWTVADDLSARGRFARAGAASPFDLDWVGQKAQDGSCPIGPGIALRRHLPDVETRRMTLEVNGVRKQDTVIDDLVAGVDALVAAASRLVTLEPGDLILTGTPAGVGLPRGEFLAVGDLVEVEIEDIGRIRHRVVAAGTTR